MKMTNKRAIRELEFLKHDIYSINCDDIVKNDYYEAIIIAIEAIKQKEKEE